MSCVGMITSESPRRSGRMIDTDVDCAGVAYRSLCPVLGHGECDGIVVLRIGRHPCRGLQSTWSSLGLGD